MIFKYWGDDCVVYHPESGNTHLLSTPHAQLLELLREPQTREETIKQIIAASFADTNDEAIALIETAATTYNQLNLLD